MKLNKIEDETFKQYVATSFSLREVIQKCGLVAAGAGYRSTKMRIAKLNLDTSHFTGMLWSKGKSLGVKRPVDYYLVEGRYTASHGLKLRLLKEGLKEHKCEICQLTEWNGLPIPIELDHINGKNDDNRLENLRILCPNCHARTPTHAGKNKGVVGAVGVEPTV